MISLALSLYLKPKLDGRIFWNRVSLPKSDGVVYGFDTQSVLQSDGWQTAVTRITVMAGDNLKAAEGMQTLLRLLEELRQQPPCSLGFGDYSKSSVRNLELLEPFQVTPLGVLDDGRIAHQLEITSHYEYKE